jgi:hypothetical protein
VAQNKGGINEISNIYYLLHAVGHPMAAGGKQQKKLHSK